jgi:lipopolysaccharide transport system ATP-binding protein
MEFAKNLQRGNATILFVSHNMFSIKTMCSRVIYLEHGRIVFDGPTDDGIKLYEENCQLSTLPFTENRREEWPIKITEIELMDEGGTPKKVFDYGERMRLRLKYTTHQPIESPSFVIAFIRSDGVACCNYSTETDGIELGSLEEGGVLELSTPPLSLVSELYTIHILVREKGFQKVLCAQIGTTFHVRHDLLDRHFGIFHEPGEWVWRNEEEKK